MRIGIDARTLSGRYTGDRTYWRGLIAGLAAVDRENEYTLYLQRPIEGGPPLVGPNFRWRLLPKPRNSALWMLRTFPRALREDGVDVAHTQYNIPLLGTPCPMVTTVHDVTFALFPELFLPRDRRLLTTLVPRSMHKAARVIAVSDSTRRDILRLYGRRVAADKVRTTLLAADPLFRPPAVGQESARAMANERLSLEDRPYALAVGVLQPRKNLGLLLDAFARVKIRAASLPHRLIVAGKRGWKNEALDRQLATLPAAVREQIVFPGYVADADLPLLYGGADALCYPSLYEGFGLPPLEAMACGCPVLCSNTSSLPEVVSNAGVLLPPDDVQAWADALDTVLTDAAQRARLRALGPARAADFSWEQTARETLEVYKEAKARADERPGVGKATVLRTEDLSSLASARTLVLPMPGRSSARTTVHTKPIMTTTHTLDPELVKILACPADDNRPPLRLEGDTLVCDQCGRIYPVRDGIPILLPEEAAVPGK